MPRDYKHRRSRRKEPTPAWVWFSGGLAAGLAIALFVHLQYQRPATTPATARPVADADAVPSSARDDSRRRAPPASGTAADSKPRFQFYEMLPNFEVVLANEKPLGEEQAASDVERAGSYVLQAGSFQNYVDADRMKAELSLQGFEPKIQRVTIDDDRWHRVRLGPYEDLSELNQARRRLRRAGVDVLTIRIGE